MFVQVNVEPHTRRTKVVRDGDKLALNCTSVPAFIVRYMPSEIPLRHFWLVERSFGVCLFSALVLPANVPTSDSCLIR